MTNCKKKNIKRNLPNGKGFKYPTLQSNEQKELSLHVIRDTKKKNKATFK